MDAPLINGYKRRFIFKRLLHTFFGGLKFGMGAPFFVYFIQIWIFVFPALLGISLMTLHIQMNLGPEGIMITFGGTMCIYTLIIQYGSYCLQLGDPEDSGKETTLMVDEDEELEFDGWFGKATWEYIVPVKKYKINIWLHALFSGLFCGFSVYYLDYTQYYVAGVSSKLQIATLKYL